MRMRGRRNLHRMHHENYNAMCAMPSEESSQIPVSQLVNRVAQQ
jgi:hypothetical protein